MILIDTSAWIAFFRGRRPLGDAVSEALETNEAALCGPVITEITRGLKSANDRRHVLPLLDGCHLLPDPPRLWADAGDLGFALARKGVTAKSLDLLIAVYALAHGAALLTGDRDFTRMKSAGIGLMLAAH